MNIAAWQSIRRTLPKFFPSESHFGRLPYNRVLSLTWIACSRIFSILQMKTKLKRTISNENQMQLHFAFNLVTYLTFRISLYGDRFWITHHVSVLTPKNLISTSPHFSFSKNVLSTSKYAGLFSTWNANIPFRILLIPCVKFIKIWLRNGATLVSYSFFLDGSVASGK